MTLVLNGTTGISGSGALTLAAASISGISTVAASGSITTTAANDGTKSSGTYTPTPIGGNMKYISNAGAFT